MNSLEIVVLVLNVGMLLWVLVTRSITKIKVGLFCIISLLTIIQVVLGARWQMIPTYCILVLTLLCMVYQNRKATRKSKRWKQFLYVGLALLYSVISFVLPSLLPAITFAKPTGDEEVGTSVLHLQEGDNELMVQAWYPAEPKNNQQRASYILDGPEVTAGLSTMVGFPDFALHHLGGIQTHAYLDVDISSTQASYPVLLFSHGLGGIRNQNTFQVEEFASHGYIVIAVDQPNYAAATVFPDGEIIENQYLNLVGAGASELDPHMDRWASNSKFVLDQLKLLNQSERFNNEMDLDRIGMVGHSYGGATAVYMLLNDDRVKAAINMDGGIFGIEDFPIELDKPLMLMAADSSLDSESFYRTLDEYSEEEVMELSGHTKEWHRTNREEIEKRRELLLAAGAESVVFEHTSHISFSDLPLYAPLLLAPQGDPQEVHKEVNETSLRFLNKHLQ